MYWNHAIKDCNLQRDFAKYSLRTIVNTQMFKTIGSDIITKDELLYLLHESFSKFNSEYHGLRDSSDGTLDFNDEEINIMLDNILKCAKVDSNKDYITYSQFMDIIFTNNVKILNSVKNKVHNKFCCCCCCQNFSTYNKNINEIKNDDENIMNRFVEEGRKISNEKPKRKPHYPVSMNEEYGFRSRNVSMNVKFESQRSRIQSENIKYSMNEADPQTDSQNLPFPPINDDSIDTQNPTVSAGPIPPELATFPVIIETRKRRNQSVNIDDLKVRSPSSSIYLPAGAGGPTGSFRNTRAITMQSPSMQSNYRKSYRKNDNSFQKICTTPNSPENTARKKQKAISRKVNLGVENIILPPLHIAPTASLSSPSATSLLSSQEQSPTRKNKESTSQDDLLKNDDETRKHSNNSHTHHHHHHHHHHDDEDQTN